MLESLLRSVKVKRIPPTPEEVIASRRTLYFIFGISLLAYVGICLATNRSVINPTQSTINTNYQQTQNYNFSPFRKN